MTGTDTENAKDARRERLFWAGAAAALLMLFVMGLYQLAQADYSAQQYEHRRKLGAVYMTLNNPYYQVVDEEIRTVVENHGDVLITRDPALSPERQEEEIRDLIADGVKVLFVTPADWREMAPALQIAREAGVPVICIDTDVQDDDHVAGTVVSDNYQAGVQCAEHLMQHQEGAHIALLLHAGARSAVDRIRGFSDTIAKDPRFVIVDRAECEGQLEQAMPAMEEMLRRHPEIDTVMALNDPTAMGAMAALEHNARLMNVSVYGVDGVPETKEMIAKGLMTATAGQSPRRTGRIAAEMAYHIFAGEDYPHYIKLPTHLITVENVRDYNLEGWD